MEIRHDQLYYLSNKNNKNNDQTGKDFKCFNQLKSYYNKEMIKYILNGKIIFNKKQYNTYSS